VAERAEETKKFGTDEAVKRRAVEEAVQKSEPKTQPLSKVERVTIDIDMERIIYGRVKKVGHSTTDLRFREPEEATRRLGLKPEDDYVAFPTEDKNKILLVRTGSVVTRGNIMQEVRKLGVKFLAPEELSRIMSVIEEGRNSYMQRTIRTKVRRFKRKKKQPK
jgi:bifunctional DNA-binding transcriptional regulator/antitoxin component of YhaV-PrlF toxin-antitoxin module